MVTHMYKQLVQSLDYENIRNIHGMNNSLIIMRDNFGRDVVIHSKDQKYL